MKRVIGIVGLCAEAAMFATVLTAQALQATPVPTTDYHWFSDVALGVFFFAASWVLMDAALGDRSEAQ